MKAKFLNSIKRVIELDSQLFEVDRELIILYHSFKYDEYFALAGSDSNEDDDLVYQFMGDLNAPLSEDWLEFTTCCGCKLGEEDEVLFLNSKYKIKENGELAWG